MSNDIVFQAISKLSRKKIEEIKPHHSLDTLGLSSSFGLSALRSVLESKTKIKLPPLSLNMRVNELIQMLESGPAPSHQESLGTVPIEESNNVATQVVSHHEFSGIGLGMDIQDIGSFEAVLDFRTDAFYSTHFTNTEISTAMLKPNPIVHFAGIFCAKEAVKKSNDALLNIDMRDFSVTHTASGRPMLNLVDGHTLAGKFQFIISITHTEHYAAATCLTFGGQFESHKNSI